MAKNALNTSSQQSQERLEKIFDILDASKPFFTMETPAENATKFEARYFLIL